jgi:hypothetical protein
MRFFEPVVASCFQNAQSRPLAGADAWHTVSVRDTPVRPALSRPGPAAENSADGGGACPPPPYFWLQGLLAQVAVAYMQAPSWKKIVVTTCQKGL